ncbi:MAG: multidrug effflux MFS transporter [Alphaproteobacteria bacterium]|nr:multidrug effflux MFS transporter [Alphaproteobacteria bacterium]
MSFSLVPRSGSFIVLLVALASFGPLSMSIYTPVLPIVGASIGATPDDVKLTLTTYMLGFAAGQLFFGPLSDRFGRRPVLLVGLFLFALTSAGCALAGSIGQLLALRVLQGLSACAGSVISRALTRDTYEFSELPRVMSWISIGVNVAPAIAPLIGGHLGEWFGWQATFWALSVFAMTLFAIVALGVGETNKHRAASLNLLAFARGSGEMLRDRRFLGFALTMGFIFGINFGMAVGMPFILQDTLGFTPGTVGYLSLIGVAGFTLGGFANNRLIGRVRPTTIVQVAPLFHITGLTIVAILSIAGTLTWWSITVPFMICSFGSGMVVPNSNAGAVGLYPRLAGTASSLVGLAQMGMGALGTIAVAVTTGLGGYDRALPLVGEWIGCTTKACAIPMPLVLAQLPFAFAAFFAARLLRTAR